MVAVQKEYLHEAAELLHLLDGHWIITLCLDHGGGHVDGGVRLVVSLVVALVNCAAIPIVPLISSKGRRNISVQTCAATNTKRREDATALSSQASDCSAAAATFCTRGEWRK
jgi:hypothetical protein